MRPGHGRHYVTTRRSFGCGVFHLNRSGTEQYKPRLLDRMTAADREVLILE
jgi:hypothetical protein